MNKNVALWSVAQAILWNEEKKDISLNKQILKSYTMLHLAYFASTIVYLVLIISKPL